MSHKVPKTTIFNVPFSNMSMSDTVQYLVEQIEKGNQQHVITANPIMVMNALKHQSIMKVMHQADLIVADGAGVIWAAQQANEPIVERIAGIELIHELLSAGEKRHWKVYILGTDEQTIATAAEILQLKYPQIRMVGYRDGFFTAEEDKQVIEEINRLKPDLLFVARGAHNQEPWIAQHRSAIEAKLIMGVGGSFDVISGKLKRAPKWMQQAKLEWLFRLLQEPKRLPRMMDIPRFMFKVYKNKKQLTQSGVKNWK